MFITNKFIQSDNISNLSYVSEKEKYYVLQKPKLNLLFKFVIFNFFRNILNIFNTNKFQTDSTHTSSYNDTFL